MNTTTSYKRINITLPEVTLELLENTIEKGKRSEFLDQAVRYFIKKIGTQNLRRELQEAGQQRSERDLTMVREWFLLKDKNLQKGK